MKFISRKGAIKGLSFSITIYNYANSRAAESKFRELSAVKTTGDEGSIFSKDYDYVVKSDNLLIRLDAGCQYSEASWNALKEQFLTAIAIKVPQRDVIECFLRRSLQVASGQSILIINHIILSPPHLLLYPVSER